MPASLSLLCRNGAGRIVSVATRQKLQRLFSRAMKAADLTHHTVCLSLSDDAELHALNLHYAGEDHATDVLSFAQSEAAILPQTPSATKAILGDIVISASIARRQAREHGHPLLDELLHLSVHGLCHLLGYDHATKKQEAVMFGYEAELRQEARKSSPVRLRPAPPLPKKSAARAAEKTVHG
jgi:probable rRNA maturation factor